MRYIQQKIIDILIFYIYLSHLDKIYNSYYSFHSGMFEVAGLLFLFFKALCKFFFLAFSPP